MNARKLPLLLLLLPVVVLWFPLPADAISQYSCPAGSTLTWQRTTVLVMSDWVCVGSNNTTSNPIQTNVAECSAGYRRDTNTWGAGICVPSTTQGTSGLSSIPVGPASCATTWDKMSSPFTCMFRAFVSLTGATLIYLSSWLLAIAGVLFNWLVDHTVVQFGNWVYSPSVKDAIETAWSAFRDIANIVIIGMFTFIAIGTIIGLQSYNAKKMVAKVIIIAVVINFSLLFTKMVIDASNFTSYQLYTAAGFGSGSSQGLNVSSTQLATSADYSKAGIAGQFISLIGVTTFGDAYNSISTMADSKDSGWVALLHGLLAAALLLGAAVVLFYGAFLLVARALMLLFLLITSAIAFGSYLIPKWSGSSYGWDAWLAALIRTAVFGPFIMIFLWITLTVGSALKQGVGQGGTLGDLLANPTKTANIDALFVYLIVLGMLYVSFKFSNMWAHRISGFDYAAMATALPFTLGFRALGLGMRYAPGLGGRGSALRALDLDAALDEKKKQLRNRDLSPVERSGLLRDVESLTRKKQRAEKRAGSTYNLMNTEAAKSLMAGIGVKGFAAGAGKEKSFADVTKQKAETAAKEAAGLALTADAKKEMREEAYRKEVQDRQQHREALKLEKTQHEEQLKQQETLIRNQTETLKAQKDRELGVKAEKAKKHDKDMEMIAKEIASAAQGSDAKRDAEARYDRVRAQKESDLKEQDNKIQSIGDQIKDVEAATVAPLKAKIEQITNKLEGDLHEGRDHAAATTAMKSTMAAAEKQNLEEAQKVGAHIAFGSFTSALQKAINLDPSKDTVAGRKAFSQTKKKLRIKDSAERWNAIREEVRGAGETVEGEEPSAPAAPASPTT